MAGKSKHGKHLPRSKRKGKKTFTAPSASKPIEAEAVETAPRAAKPMPKSKAPAVAAEVSNVVAELRRIGLVAGVIVVILVILALIFA
jgi:hypothetical protein